MAVQQWTSLPAEMKISIIHFLDIADVRSLSEVDQRTYSACVPSLFKSVQLASYNALKTFIDNVPRGYCRFVECLDLAESEHTTVSSQEWTDAISTMLCASPRLQKLSIQLAGLLNVNVIPAFAHQWALKDLSLSNCADENMQPLSERLVVAIAATIPNLQQLSLDRVSRSLIHAPDLVGVYPYVPLVTGDDNIPNHPLLGSDLYLPSLLRIPSLRKLTIRDTHLGDSRWATTPVDCRLEVLDLGSCYHETEDFNRACTERIMTAVGRTVDEFSLTTSVSDMTFAKPAVTPLQRLRKLHITPFFPIDSVVDTMSNLAGSPIESLSVQCFEDDVVDACAALEEFLTLRVERGAEFYEKLARIDVAVASNDSSIPVVLESNSERMKATKRLQDFCRDLRLASHVRAHTSIANALDIAGMPQTTNVSASDGRVRAMSI